MKYPVPMAEGAPGEGGEGGFRTSTVHGPQFTT